MIKITDTERPIISIVAAVSVPSRIIGVNNNLIYRLPKDMELFKSLTMHKTCVMGYNTAKSIPGGYLKFRDNIIFERGDVSSSYMEFHDPFHARVIHVCGNSFEEQVETMLHYVGESPELMIIGGGYIYEKFIDLADYLYLTEIHHTPSVEDLSPVLFPKFNDMEEWNEDDYPSRAFCMTNREINFTDQGLRYDFTVWKNVMGKEYPADVVK